MVAQGTAAFSRQLAETISKAISGPDRWEQHWQCIGLLPMHRALIYRLALAELQGSWGANRRILWRPSQAWEDSTEPSGIDGGIEWIDAGLWVNSQVHGPTPSHSGSAMRVLWCWNLPNWKEFLALSPWMAKGVVYNLPSLKSWIRQSLRLGKWHAAAGCSLPLIETPITCRS